MTIPVRNIYYLLLYAWGHFRSAEVRDIGGDESPDLPNLLAKMLNESTHRLLRRGLDRGYIERTEETRSLRGKLRLDLMTKQQTLIRGIAVCDMDELTPDVLHNQILLTTLISLANCKEVERPMKHELKSLARRVQGVSNVRLSSDLFRRVQLSRNTSQYGLLMRICELVFHSLLPDERGSGSRFHDILHDEVRMSALFEDFLRNFYREELPGYSSGSEIMPWNAEAENKDNLAYLPVMKTDITLRSASRTIVADAKYYKDILSGGRYGEKVRSDHLYQLSTYLAHVRAKEPSGELSGLLIYPSSGESIRLKYKLFGIPVEIASLDLNSDWKKIHQELIGLVRDTENSS